MLGLLAPRSDIWSALFYQKVESLTNDEAALIASGYIWFDWFLTQLKMADACQDDALNLATVPIDCESRMINPSLKVFDSPNYSSK